MAGKTEKSNHLDERQLGALRRCLSGDRFGTYEQASGGDARLAAKLYSWNTAASAALFGPLHWLEVALRNAMHEQLADRFGADWYDQLDDRLSAGCLGRLSDARHRLRPQDAPATAGRLVAALPFGFWVSLLGRGGKLENGNRANYEMALWRPCLRRAFVSSEPMTRRHVHSELDDLRKLRNRIAHHEPIFRRDLASDYARILDALGWISPEVAAWVQQQSRVEEVLAADRTEFIRW